MTYYQHLKNLTIQEIDSTGRSIMKLNCTNKKYNLAELCLVENKVKQECAFTRIDKKNDSVELNPK